MRQSVPWPYEVKPFDVNELVLNSSAMFGRTKKEIQIHTNCQTSSLVVEADRGAEIDLVILDMIMPGMDGGTTFDRIREIQPDMPVIISSGYAINGHADKIMRRGCNGFIQKPYNISEISQKIRKVLDEAKRSTSDFVIPFVTIQHKLF
ncbi:MAG: response regulator [Pseudomonadota bacterium]